MPKIEKTKATPKKRALKSKQSMEREKKIFLGVVIGIGVSLVIHLIIQIVVITSTKARAENELDAAVLMHAVEVQEDQLIFAGDLEIASSAKDQNLAFDARKEEWQARQNMDPAYATTKMEKAMLEMQRIGMDESISDEDALEKIAKLAGPPRTGVGVSRVRRGYKVEVAFAYDEVIEAHPEMGNYMPGIYLEVRRTAAGIIRDVFKFGKPRDPYQVIANCQQVVTISGQRGKRQDLRNMLIANGRDNRSWSSYNRAEAEDAYKLVRDYFSTLIK